MDISHLLILLIYPLTYILYSNVQYKSRSHMVFLSDKGNLLKHFLKAEIAKTIKYVEISENNVLKILSCTV